VWGVANLRWEIGRQTAGKTSWDRGGGLQGRGSPGARREGRREDGGGAAAA
jgi:hypothetical protein